MKLSKCKHYQLNPQLVVCEICIPCWEGGALHLCSYDLGFMLIEVLQNATSVLFKMCHVVSSATNIHSSGITGDWDSFKLLSFARVK